MRLSLNSTNGFPFIKTLSPFISTLIVTFVSPLLRIIISCCSFISGLSGRSGLSGLSGFSFCSGLSCCYATAVKLNAIQLNANAVKIIFFILIYLMYEMFGRSNISRIY